jgi:hypothetical protein
MREELMLECKGSNEQKVALKCTKKIIELKTTPFSSLVRMDRIYQCGSASIPNQELVSSLSEARELPLPRNKIKTEFNHTTARQSELDTVSKKISSASKCIRELKVKLKWNKGEMMECEQSMTDAVVLLNSLQMQMKELEKEHGIAIRRVYTNVGAILKTDNKLFSAMFNS